jgi:hypothetical protein
MRGQRRATLARIDSGDVLKGTVSVVEESCNLLGDEVSLDKNFRTTAAPA